MTSLLLVETLHTTRNSSKIITSVQRHRPRPLPALAPPLGLHRGGHALGPNRWHAPILAQEGKPGGVTPSARVEGGHIEKLHLESNSRNESKLCLDSILHFEMELDPQFTEMVVNILRKNDPHCHVSVVLRSDTISVLLCHNRPGCQLSSSCKHSPGTSETKRILLSFKKGQPKDHVEHENDTPNSIGNLDLFLLHRCSLHVGHALHMSHTPGRQAFRRSEDLPGVGRSLRSGHRRRPAGSGRPTCWCA